MVKLRVGKKSKSTAKDSGVVTSEFKKVHRFSPMPHVNVRFLRTRRGVIAASVVVLLLIALGAFIVWRLNEANKPVVTKIQSESDYISQGISDLQNSVPDSEANDEVKIAYYDRLQGYSEQAEDYKAALDAFLKRADIRQSDLDYMDYASAARYYMKLGDKQGANAAIDKAISLLPPAANESTGYDPVVTKEELLKAKQL